MWAEGSLSIDSKNHYGAMIDRDNEFFWTEKFILPAGLNSYALIAD
jgi:hypothetical protein